MTLPCRPAPIFETPFVPRALLLPVLLAAALLLPSPAAAEPGLWKENDQSRVRLVTPWAEAPAAGELFVGLEFEVVPGWHVYWKNSGDAGYPPAISFAPTPEVLASELLYPAPERYELPGDLVAFGYEGRVVYPVRLELDAVGLDGITLAADLDYLVCEVDCVPYSYRLTVDQPLAAPGAEPLPDEVRAEELAVWRARVPRPVDDLAGLGSDGVLDLSDPDRPRLTVTVSGATPGGGAPPELFLESHELFDADRPEVEPGDGVTRFHVPLTFRQRPDELPQGADFAWTVSGLVPAAAAEAVPLEARRTVPARGVAAAGAQPTVPGAGPLTILLGVLAGGLLLHLFPSVLPLTALRLGEVADGGALATAGGLFAGGLAVGLTGAGLAAGGRAVTWGFQLQEPVLLAALAVLAALAALELWGVIGLLPTRHDGLRGLLLGLAAAALALAWNPPFLARSFGPAWAGDAGHAFAVVVAGAFALGLALPFLLAAAAPGWTAPLRRLAARGEGEARSAACEALAFLELAAVLWILYLLHGQVTNAGLAFIQGALLAVALGAWLLGSSRRPVWTAVAVLLLLLGAVTTLRLADTHRTASAAAGTGSESIAGTESKAGTESESPNIAGTALPAGLEVDPTS